MAKKKAKGSKPGRKALEISIEEQEILINIADMGATDTEMAKAIGVTRPTFLDYRKKNPDFDRKIRLQKARSDGDVFASLKKSAVGYEHDELKHFVVSDGVQNGSHVEAVETIKKYPPNAMSIKFYLMNRQPGKFRNKFDITNDEIKNMTDQELEDKVRELLINGEKE